MIVKVQLPLMSTEDNPTALIYDRNRVHAGSIPITDELTEAMGKDVKAYFRATYNSSTGLITLYERVSNKNW